MKRSYSWCEVEVEEREGGRDCLLFVVVEEVVVSSRGGGCVCKV